ncbi:hypothetical protein [Brachybacterium kimchii]|uniref:Preprotein translocase subunit SecB n=1 Tax=Brachybacterium kimchii TaxID=2942909 RepID=A0ABY4N955_9MICO|nr:hypothetical protein [Brachybacterium kimchii]UQN30639.1 hypothetical protein M4486_04880 [Brachybacterium kimchii]
MSPLKSASEIVTGPGPVLKDVRFYKMLVELSELNEGGPNHSQERPDEELEDGEVSMDFGLRTRQSGPQLGIRVEFEARHRDWLVKLDAAAEYEAEADFEATNDACIDFADEVGIMTLFPYIREALGNLTQRSVGASYILPTIERGKVRFGAPAPSE